MEVKLPWISREAHEAVIAGLHAQIGMAQDVARQWSAYASDLHAKIDQLTTPTPEPVPAAPLAQSPKEPNIIQQTIRELAQGDQRMAQFLHTRKRELRQEQPHMSDEAIAALLGAWQTSEDLMNGEVT